MVFPYSESTLPHKIRRVSFLKALRMPVYIWYPSLGGLSLGFTFMNIPPVADQFMELYSVGYAGLSLLLSATIWAHALFQIPAGLVADRIPPRLAALIACVLATLSALAPLLAPANFTLAFVCRCAAGLCTALLFLAQMKLITLLAPAESQANAQGIYGGMIGFGTMLPYIVLPLFGATGRIWAQILVALLYAATGLALFCVPKVALPEKAADGTQDYTIWHILRTVVFSPTMLAIGMIHGFIYGTLNNTGQWLPSILADLSGRPIADWALASTLVLLVGSATRLASGTFLRFTTMSKLILTSSFLLSVFYFVLGLVPTPGLAIAAGLTLAVVCSMAYGAVFGLTIKSFSPVYIGVCYGYQTTLANLVYVCLTLLYGTVRDKTDSFAWAQFAAGLASFAALAAFGGKIRKIGTTEATK